VGWRSRAALIKPLKKTRKSLSTFKATNCSAWKSKGPGTKLMPPCCCKGIERDNKPEQQLLCKHFSSEQWELLQMPEGPLDPLRTRRSTLMANYSLVSGSAPVPYLNAHLLNVTTVNMNAWQDKACLNLVWYLNELSILDLLNKHGGL